MLAASLAPHGRYPFRIDGYPFRHLLWRDMLMGPHGLGPLALDLDGDGPACASLLQGGAEIAMTRKSP